MNAIEYLKQINKLETIIKNKMLERQRWVEISQSCGSFSVNERVQSSGNPHKMSDAVTNYMDIDREIAELKRERNAIIKTIESLPTLEYDILHKIYVQDFTILDVADYYGKSCSWASQHKRNALDHLQTILDAMPV